MALETQPCKSVNIKEKNMAVKKTISILNAIRPTEKNLKSVKWTGMIPDGCYCKDKIGTDGKPFNEHFFVCSVGAGSGLEITYSHALSINRIQYFEP